MKPARTPAEARQRGQKTYYTGRACPRGHRAPRYVTNTDCAECVAIHTRARTARRAAEYAARMESTLPQRLEKRKQYGVAWRAAHAEKLRASARGHYEANKAAYVRKAREWGRRNPAVILARVRRRQVDKLHRTPPWADLQKIKAIYLEARARGNGSQVDHVIPLRGRLVSGLHVHENLQILPGDMNRSKGNRFEE